MFVEIYQDTVFEHEDLPADVSVDFFWRGYWLMLSTKHRVWTSPVAMKTGWGKRWHRDMPILCQSSTFFLLPGRSLRHVSISQHQLWKILEDGRAIFVNQLSCLTRFSCWLGTSHYIQGRTNKHSPKVNRNMLYPKSTGTPTFDAENYKFSDTYLLKSTQPVIFHVNPK